MFGLCHNLNVLSGIIIVRNGPLKTDVHKGTKTCLVLMACCRKENFLRTFFLVAYAITLRLLAMVGKIMLLGQVNPTNTGYYNYFTKTIMICMKLLRSR